MRSNDAGQQSAVFYGAIIGVSVIKALITMNHAAGASSMSATSMSATWMGNWQRQRLMQRRSSRLASSKQSVSRVARLLEHPVRMIAWHNPLPGTATA